MLVSFGRDGLGEEGERSFLRGCGFVSIILTLLIIFLVFIEKMFFVFEFVIMVIYLLRL